jgi:hypothetical protein
LTYGSLITADPANAAQMAGDDESGAQEDFSAEVRSLILRAQAGDRGAFEQLMILHQRQVLGTAFRLLHRLEDARDAAQEVFLKLFRNLPRIRAEANLRPWLYRVHHLLDTIVGRSSSLPLGGGYSTEGFTQNPAVPDANIPYLFSYNYSKLNHNADGDSVHLDQLRLALQFKTKKLVNGLLNDEINSQGLMTNLDLRPGQMVVVGKTNFEVGNNALSAVISAKVVE